jgi:hypothetical protein
MVADQLKRIGAWRSVGPEVLADLIHPLPYAISASVAKRRLIDLTQCEQLISADPISPPIRHRQYIRFR